LTLALVTLVGYVPLALFRGWVISLLWGWYVADYFGFARLTIVEAVGLGILVSVFTSHRNPDDGDRSVWLDLTYAVMFPALGLLFGWAWSFAR
jgi:hypothetical protein